MDVDVAGVWMSHPSTPTWIPTLTTHIHPPTGNHHHRPIHPHPPTPMHPRPPGHSGLQVSLPFPSPPLPRSPSLFFHLSPRPPATHLLHPFSIPAPSLLPLLHSFGAGLKRPAFPRTLRFRFESDISKDSSFVGRRPTRQAGTCSDQLVMQGRAALQRRANRPYQTNRSCLRRRSKFPFTPH